MDGLGRNIRKRRESLGESREDFAARSGLSPSTIARAELGYHTPSLPSLERIALAFGVSLSELFDDANGGEAAA